MTTVKKSAFWIIFFVVFIDLIGFGIVFPLLPLYARQFHMTEFQIGIVLGIYSLMQFIFAPILGKLSDKVGRRPVLLVSMLGTAFSFFMLAWSKSFWWFFIARALDGVAGSNLATAQAYIADISPKEQRTRNMGMWIGAAFGLGFAFGPFIGGALQVLGEHVWPTFSLGFPFFVAGLICFLNVAFAWFMLPESLPLRDSEHSVGRRTFSWGIIQSHVSDIVGPLIFSYAVIIFAFAQMEATFTWISHDLFHQGSLAIYALFGYLGIVMAFTQGGLVRRLAPKLGDKNLTLLGCALMVVGLAGLPLIHTLAWLLLTSGILAVGESFCNPALISSISKGATEFVQGETMGVTQSLASLSRFLGPVTAGYLYQHYGAPSPYLTAAIVMLFAINLSLSGFKKLSQAPDNREPLSA
jgi:MFS transporter, DHA1 family, tetracycline resistance protein